MWNALLLRNHGRAATAQKGAIPDLTTAESGLPLFHLDVFSNRVFLWGSVKTDSKVKVMRLNHILLASHGSMGARAAEEAALELAHDNNARLTLLYIVPDFWRGMRGDDWLNNAITQEEFGDYLESQLLNEARQETQRIARRATDKGLDITIRAMFGKPTECLLSAVRELMPDLVVIGSPRPKGIPGYRSRIYLETITRALPCPLLILPHPFLTGQA